MRSAAHELSTTEESLEHERTLREILLLVTRSTFPDNRSFLGAAAAFRGKYLD